MPNVDIRDGSKSETALLGISDSGIGNTAAIRHQPHRQVQYRANRINATAKSETAQSAISDKRHRQSATQRQFGARDSGSGK